MKPELQAQLEKFLDEIESAAEGAITTQIRTGKSRSLDAVFEQGLVAGKLEDIKAIVKSIRETLDE